MRVNANAVLRSWTLLGSYAPDNIYPVAIDYMTVYSQSMACNCKCWTSCYNVRPALQWCANNVLYNNITLMVPGGVDVCMQYLDAEFLTGAV